MIDDAIAELTPLIGVRAACTATGRAAGQSLPSVPGPTAAEMGANLL